MKNYIQIELWKALHKKIWAIIVGTCLLFLPACQHTSNMPLITPDGQISSIEESPSWANDSHNTFPMTYYIDQSLKSGKLMCTVNNVHLVEEPPNIGMFKSDATCGFMDGNVIQYPDFLQDNGHLIPGLYLLLVNITVFSEDATAFTRRDNDSANGIVKGEYDDPYVFRSDDLICLIEIGMDDGRIIGAGDVYLCYYSGMGQRAEHKMAFRLEPGESIDFSLGFLVSDVSQGGVHNLENLYLSVGMTDNPNETLIHLALSGEEVLHS